MKKAIALLFLILNNVSFAEIVPLISFGDNEDEARRSARHACLRITPSPGATIPTYGVGSIVGVIRCWETTNSENLNAPYTCAAACERPILSGVECSATCEINTALAIMIHPFTVSQIGGTEEGARQLLEKKCSTSFHIRAQGILSNITCEAISNAPATNRTNRSSSDL